MSLHRRLHLCGAILLLFSASHIGFLFLHTLDLELQNVVFPILSNRVVFIVAAAVELAAGLTCLLSRSEKISRLAVLLFLVTVIWYRLSLNFFDGLSGCSCLGLLGHLLHVSKAMERVVPLAALGAMASLAFLPANLLAFRSRSTAVALLLMWFIAAPLAPNVYAGYRLTGTVEVKAFNPLTGIQYSDMAALSKFEVYLDKNTFQITIRNISGSDWWNTFTYDGKRSVLRSPADGSYYGKPSTNKNEQLAIVSDSPIPLLEHAYDALGLSAVWATYCIQPQLEAGKLISGAEIPLLWESPRGRLDAYGYRWNMVSSDGRLNHIEILRDESLDVPPDQETLRLTLDDTGKVSQINDWKKYILIRKAQKHGFSMATYNATEFRPDGIPTKSQMDINLGQSPDYLFTYLKFRIGLTECIVEKGTTVELGVVDKNTLVHDYTYGKVTPKGIFRWASYKLEKGQGYRAGNDPTLISEREQALHANRILAFWAKQSVAWGLLPISLLVFGIGGWLFFGSAKEKKVT